VALSVRASNFRLLIFFASRAESRDVSSYTTASVSNVFVNYGNAVRQNLSEPVDMAFCLSLCRGPFTSDDETSLQSSQESSGIYSRSVSVKTEVPYSHICLEIK
jgi:hypothetical protein